MTYLINLENTGLDNDEQVAAMAEMMRADGHDVAATELFGHINPNASCPVGDQEWMDYLERADRAATRELVDSIPGSASVNYRPDPEAPAEQTFWRDQDQAFKDQLIGAEHTTVVDDGALDSIDLTPSYKTIHTITLKEDGETIEVIWSE